MRKANEVLETILTVVASAAAVQTAIHDVALECLQHAEAHGDVTLIDRLIKELEAKAVGQRTATLRDWVRAYSPIRWTTKDDKVGLMPKKAEKYVAFNTEAANAKPYYTMGKETRPRELTLEQIKATLGRLLKTIEKAENGEGTAVIKDGEDVAAMKALARKAGMLALGSPVSLVPDTNENIVPTTPSVDIVSIPLTADTEAVTA